MLGLAVISVWEKFADADQMRVDEAVRAVAWSLYKPEHAKELAEIAVEDTGLGNVPDKIVKKQRKTFGTLRDLLRTKSVGEIERDEKLNPPPKASETINWLRLP